MPDATEAAAPIRPNDIAVIGMCGRFPGAPDVATLWSRLRAGDDLLTTFTDAELAAAGAPPRVLRDPAYVRRAAVLPDAFRFDHEFFGYTRREAMLLDPQQRILLEVASELLETIGYAGAAGEQAVGVFAGASMNTYLPNLLGRHCDPLGYDGTEIMIANDKDYLTTRISYKLGLRGPSVNVQTACSTSLVAVHLAVQSLVTGECDIALAGGVSVIANPYPGYTFSEGMILSPDGRCRPFDAAGAGTTFGDGVGLVALKRLAEAIADGDRVLAVVKGSAINNDGSDKIGYTAPSTAGQRAVIAEAQAVAEVGADTITYVEAHGTATTLGDPVEFAALREAFVAGGARPGRRECALGSVKANVGHLAAAAGVTGLIKAVLALQHREIPGHPTFARPNPEIDLDDSPFFVNTAPMPWAAGPTPRRAGVSSFGIGGTNAHVVLEEAPPAPAAPAPADGPWLLAVSAKSDAALRELARRVADELAGADAPGLADAAYTLRAGRRVFAHRHAVVADDHAGAVAGLRALAGRPVAPAPSAPAVSLLFGATGAEELRALAGRLPAVADLVDRCTAGAGVADDPSAAAVTAAQVLAALWTESGVRPAAVGGAGAGEVLAACVAGALDPSAAAALLSWRAGRLDRPPAVRPRAPRMPILSAVTGGELPAARVLDPRHWTRDVWVGDRLAEAFAGAGAAVLAVGAAPAGAGFDPVPAPPTVAGLLAAAARLWVEGVPVDWSAWSGGRPRRVPLPTHPLRGPTLRPDAPGAPAVPGGAAARADGPWLLFADAGGAGDALAGALREGGAAVCVVRAGRRFERVDADSFVVDPAEAGDRERLSAALAAAGFVPGRVVHLWSFDPPAGTDADRDVGLDRPEPPWTEALDLVLHAGLRRLAAAAGDRRPAAGAGLRRTLARLWSEVLRTDVDRYDLSLFDLGGDELLAVRLARRIEQELALPLTARELLANPTIDRLAARLDPTVTA
nr:hypothetical protein GCM10020063_047360 [Dactylosporangium thailandense]